MSINKCNIIKRKVFTNLFLGFKLPAFFSFYCRGFSRGNRQSSFPVYSLIQINPAKNWQFGCQYFRFAPECRSARNERSCTAGQSFNHPSHMPRRKLHGRFIWQIAWHGAEILRNIPMPVRSAEHRFPWMPYLRRRIIQHPEQEVVCLP